jgi:uncharacterized repeat protein (TIGR01451 family)
MIDINPAPLFNKAFVQSGYTILPGVGQVTPPSPFVIGINGISSLVFTIDNTASSLEATNLNFVDNLPTDLILATPVNAQTNCTGGILTAADGAISMSYTGGSVAAGELCVVVVDVTSSVLGTYNNVSDSLTSSLGDSGSASHSIIVSNITIVSKSFARDVDIINTPNTLTFTFDNSVATANNLVSLNDPLPTGMQIANSPNIMTDCNPFFSITAPPSGTTISLIESNLLAGTSCSFSIDIIATVSGTLVNLTDPLSTDLGQGNQAMATLIVEQPPVFTKLFAPTSIGLGEVSTLTLTIDNSANTIDATDLDFTDNLPAGVTLATPANATTTCTGGTLVAADGTANLSYTGGTVSAGANCSVSADVTSSTLGTVTNVTSDLTSSHGNSGTATADLTVNVTDGLTFTKAYADLAVSGGNVTLSFVINNSNNANATNINFTDNLSAQITANATNLPINDACGSGSLMSSNGGVIQLTGGNLAAGDSCQIDVNVMIGELVAPGVYNNTTSPLSADFGTATIESPPASADFTVVSAPTITKVFNDGNITSGDTVELTFSITNNSPVDATQISFSDNLDNFINESTAINLPQNDVCGVGSVLSGTSTILLQNGVLAANSSCQFTVTVLVPIRTPSDNYINVTSPVTADYNGNGVTGSANTVASATLYVQAFVYPVPLLTDWKLLTLLIFFMLLMANVMFYRSERR